MSKTRRDGIPDEIQRMIEESARAYAETRKRLARRAALLPKKVEPVAPNARDTGGRSREWGTYWGKP